MTGDLAPSKPGPSLSKESQQAVGVCVCVRVCACVCVREKVGALRIRITPYPCD